MWASSAVEVGRQKRMVWRNLDFKYVWIFTHLHSQACDLRLLTFLLSLYLICNMVFLAVVLINIINSSIKT